MRQTSSSKHSDPLTLQHWFIISCCFSWILLCVRVAAIGRLTYIFMIWNLFLALIPYYISYQLYKNLPAIKSKLHLIASVAIWLLFIPNSFYILTDLFHLHEMSSAPKWFDLLLLTSFAWNGLFLGITSLQMMERVLEKLSGRAARLSLIFSVMTLNAYGIYIGRFLRYNSWDVVTQPLSLMGDLWTMFLHPLQNGTEWGMVLGYGVFMTLLYMTIRKMGEGFIHLNSNETDLNKQY